MRPVVCVFLFWLGVAVCSGAGRQVTDSARLASGLAIDLTYPSEAPPKAAQIMVHVSDPDGLDDLTITSVSEDLRYQTNLSGSQPTRELRRVFALTDLFQARWTEEIHDEWMRNVLATRPDVTRESLVRCRELMDGTCRIAWSPGTSSSSRPSRFPTVTTGTCSRRPSTAGRESLSRST